MKNLKKIVFVLFLFAFCIVNAQVTTSSIKGLIMDESGASFQVPTSSQFIHLLELNQVPSPILMEGIIYLIYG